MMGTPLRSMVLLALALALAAGLACWGAWGVLDADLSGPAKVWPPRLLGLGLAACLVGALALGAVAWSKARALEVSIAAVRSAVNEYQQGRLDVRPAHPPLPALAELGQGLRQMAQTLDERQRDLLRQLSEHEAVLSSMGEGVVAVSHDMRVLTLNAAARRMFGVGPPDARHNTLLEVVRNTELLRLTQNALAGLIPVNGEIVLPGPPAQLLEVHGRQLLDGSGKSIGALVVLSDVTALRRLETLRRDFVANVSHELKTPVTTIKGFVETLLDGGRADPEQSEHFLRIISRQAERLSAIIEDLLNLSRIERDTEAGEIPLETAPLHPVLQAALQSCEVQARARAILLECECPPGLTARVNGPLLEQALVNLIDNAIKYSPMGGTVRVTGTEAPGAAVLSVRDWGVGIADKHLPRLFERFYRVDKSRSRKQGGTGLGLAIVKHIAQAHGGQVQVESEPGKGSVFSLHLAKALEDLSVPPT